MQDNNESGHRFPPRLASSLGLYSPVVPQCSAYRSRPGHLLASKIDLLLVGTYALGKDPRIDPFCVWGNEIFMNKYQVRKLISIISKRYEWWQANYLFMLYPTQQ